MECRGLKTEDKTPYGFIFLTRDPFTILQFYYEISLPYVTRDLCNYQKVPQGVCVQGGSVQKVCFWGKVGGV